MGWFFGCFGGSRKKARKHGPPPVSQKSFEQVPSQPSPQRVSASSASIPIKPRPVEEEVRNKEDLLHRKKFPNSAPVQRTEGFLNQERTDRAKSPQERRREDPWSQLDELEEELEDLRKQIEQESNDAKKIKDEVTLLRSGGSGTIRQPSLSPKRQRGEQSSFQQNVSPIKGFQLSKFQNKDLHNDQGLRSVSSLSTESSKVPISALSKTMNEVRHVPSGTQPKAAGTMTTTRDISLEGKEINMNTPMKRLVANNRYDNADSETVQSLSLSDTSDESICDEQDAMDSARSISTRNKRESNKYSRHALEIDPVVEKKGSDWIDIPKTGTSPRIRSKLSSPVLTPVENVFQWQELKEKEKEQSLAEVDIKAVRAKDVSAKLETKVKCDENINGTNHARAESVGVNASLSNWLIPKQKEDGIHTVKDEDVNQNCIGVDTSLSHWLKPNQQQNSMRTQIQSGLTAGLQKDNIPSNNTSYSTIAMRRARWDGGYRGM